MNLWPWLVLATVHGACIGSFLNVVIYRLPEGKSLITPGSMCPKCGHKLAWYDNVPVLSWLWLGGKCRYCKAPISFQYPLIELLTGLMFGMVFWVWYMSGLRPELSETTGLPGSWPALLVVLTMLAALMAGSVIDIKLYIIPLSLPWLMVIVAGLVYPLSVQLGWLDMVYDLLPRMGAWHHLPYVPDGGWELGLGIGGMVGLAVANGLLWKKWIPRSFDEEPGEEGAGDTPEEWLAHPHPRREVSKELLFLVWPMAGALVGAVVTVGVDSASVPGWLDTLGASLTGLVLGAGLIWAVRVLGTLGFGKEAMGLGDVHLMAGLGMVLGWMDAVVLFFVAPFMGLLAALVMEIRKVFAKGEPRYLPYGPYLALAALVMVCWRVPIMTVLGMLPR